MRPARRQRARGRVPARRRRAATAATAAALLERGPRSVVVTLGPDGVLVADGSGTAHVPSPKVEAVDTTGAGDAFTAALCLRLARGDALRDAAAAAARAAPPPSAKPGA
ncbi:PfkB family carbohydrate kinase, partial [Actinomadura sp. CNU-125]|uniref:PfkB family carbohydrate kinase n=1 Tax=Actinomadura sp. CNU-125 TaxID=1904961 RepID=UPI0021CC75BD